MAAWSSSKVSEGTGNTRLQRPRRTTYEDLVKAGIIDPTKVTRSALQNAASVTILLLTTDALIADAPEDKKPAGGAAATAVTTTCIEPTPVQALHVR